MWNRYVNAASTGEVLEILSVNKEKAKIVAGATDLMLEFEKGIRKGIDTVIDISRISGLDNIILDEDNIIHLGPLVTHNQAASTKLLREKGYLLSRASWEVGAPQIRNRGTVAGNIITASPANDTITPLMALNATVTLQSTAGSRKVSLKDFYTGVRKTVMKPDEMLIDIAFPALTSNHKSAFLKVALRRAQAISVVNIAIILFLEGNKINDAVITLGAVAPTIIHAEMAEKYLSGKQLSPEIIEEAAKLTALAAKPIDDLRGTADYRKEMVRVFTKRGLLSILNNEEQSGMPENPITLSVNLPTSSMKSASFKDNSIINTKINGTEYSILDAGNKSLLRLIRENAGLTGTKEGCAEGECGACTVFLDGNAIMACLVPAARADQAEIITIEGLSTVGQLHPVQDAFIQDGAVQCGYCSPGFLMSAAKLLETHPKPTKNQIEEAITGNLCRCTGYYKIVQAIENAAQK